MRARCAPCREPTARTATARFELYSRINIGVVVATDDAYAIPTVFDADEKAIDGDRRELERLRARTRAGELLAPEASGATFTLWHPGLDGVAQATPIVIPPQAGALAAGAVRRGAAACVTQLSSPATR